jgi:PIN domain nuclease of toxin-antitoxin system
MKILLDTQIFLWYVAGDRHLPEPIQYVIRDTGNSVFLRVATNHY